TVLAVASPAAEAAALSVGSRGPAVLALNQRLADLGYLPRRKVTSVFTRVTHHAVIAFQKYEGLTRDGVVGKRTSTALRDARRPRPRLVAGGRRIEIWRDRQIALLVVNGVAVRTIAVSTGKTRYTTPRGRFSVYRRERMSWSYSYRVWLPWAAYFNRGIALHGYRSVPVYAASHGCVRIPLAFACEVYEFAWLGTRVDVL
ncbi:MAG: L,D-transpeptidase family protein, partial [Actinomycetota bacterium]|nr:L,D-transpeptidase family protein [Actinomycetota bacterium]